MTHSTSRKKLLIAISLPILGLALGGVSRWCTGSKATHEPFGGGLPPTASDIHEQDIDMFPDWEYYFRASMPAQDCDALLMKVASKEKLLVIPMHDWLDGKGDWGPGQPPTWWDPDYSGGHYHGRSGDVNTCAMCRSGVFYYWYGSH